MRYKILCKIFYKKFLKKVPNIAITGLNPHCESLKDKNEEKEIINPAIKILSKKKIRWKMSKNLLQKINQEKIETKKYKNKARSQDTLII